MTRRKILITGAAGFVGYHLASSLVADQDCDLTLVDNLSRGVMDPEFSELCKQPNLRFYSKDLLGPAAFNELGRDFDEVYHLAALLGVENVLRNPVAVLNVNTVLTLKLLEWALSNGIRKIFFSSTSEVYAWTQLFHPLPVPTAEDVPLSLTDLKNPRTTYAASKIFSELAVTNYCVQAQVPFVIARYHNVYGPRMGNDHVIPQLYQRAVGGQNPLVVYSPQHIRAFCFVSDAVSATITAMRTESAANQTINIGNDQEQVTIQELAEKILRCANLDYRIEPKNAANDPIARRCPDISKARNLLGYEPAVSLENGLKRTLSWYSRAYSQAR